MSSTALAFAFAPFESPSTTAAWTHVALLCLIAALAVALLILGVHLLRARRGQMAPAASPGARPPEPPPVEAAARRASGSTPAAERRAPGAGGAGGGLAAVPASSGAPLVCPACRREYPAGALFCSYDSRRLVPAGDLVERGRVATWVCPRCRRSYAPGLRYCPHDAEELIPAPLWEARPGKRQDVVPTGVVAKICPRCAARYDLATTFCGRDGAELMTIN